jgi:hypothetical protein
MPDDTTANVMPLFDRISRRMIKISYVFLAPSGALKKKNPPCPAETASMMRS